MVSYREAAGKVAKTKEKELEEWLRGLEGMDRLVDDYVGDKIPLWEKIMDRQGTVCCTWEKTAFEEGLKVGIRLMVVSRVMRKFDLALAEIYFRGRVHAPWLPSSGQGAKGQGRRYAARLALDAL